MCVCNICLCVCIIYVCVSVCDFRMEAQTTELREEMAMAINRVSSFSFSFSFSSPSILLLFLSLSFPLLQFEELFNFYLLSEMIVKRIEYQKKNKNAKHYIFVHKTNHHIHTHVCTYIRICS
mgnify:CR=1 FL=1